MVQGVVSIPLPGLSLQTDVCASKDPEVRFRTRSYVAGTENRLALAAVDSLLGDSPDTFSPLLLTGPTGVGKSHLVQGLRYHWRRTRPDAHTVLSTWRDFNQMFAAATWSEHLAEFRTDHRTARLFIIEGFLAPRPGSSVEREFLHTLDALQAQSAAVVITSQLSLREMPHLSPYLKSRLSRGLVLTLVPPGPVARQEILHQLAVARGLKLAEKSFAILANGLDGTVPQIATALLDLEPAIRAATPSEQPEITRQFTRRCPTPLRACTRQIVAVTAKHFSLKPSDLRGPSRKRTVALARSVAIFLTRKTTNVTFQQIGKYLGGRDHSTILYNYRKTERLITTDATLRATIAQLERALSNG